MFMPTTVLDWRIDGGRRVPDAAGDWYILNTNRMFEIKTDYEDNLYMFYFDNPADSRDGGAHMKVDDNLAALNIYADTDHGSEAVTLEYFPDDDTSATPLEITLTKASIAYCYPVAFQKSHNYCYLVYVDAGWNKNRILVSHSWIILYGLLEA
jgi:hypothetical protein